MTTVNITPTPVQRFVDSNGNALVGGQLFTYQAGTTTKVATYTDATGSVQNTNPIILNQRGECSIWLLPTQSYKFVLATATDTDPPQSPIWTEDQIQATGAEATGNMIDEKGSGGTPGFAANVDFTPGTTTVLTLSNNYGSSSNLWVTFDGAEQGADTFSLSGTNNETLTFNAPIPVGVEKVYVKGGTSLTLGAPAVGSVTDSSVATGSKLYDRIAYIFNVKDYGAIGNGTTDDTAAIQSAENAVFAAGGGKLHFPAGTYSVNATGISKLSNVDWVGAEFGVTSIKAKAVTYANGLIYGTGISGFKISDMQFDWTLANNTLIGTINLNTSSDYVIERCNFIGNFAFAISHNGGNRFVIRDNTFYRTSAGGGAQCQSIEVSTGSGTCQWGVIENNYMYLAGMNFSGQNCLINNNKVYDWQFGGGITTEQNNNCSELTITNNTCIGGNGEDVNETICLGIENWAPRSLIAGNHCEANSGDGISNGGQNCIVAYNHCVNNGQMSGNGITSRYSSGTVNGNYSTYIGNECVDTQSTHTQIYGYADYNSSVFGNFVVGNTFENNLSGPMNILGTTAVCTPSFQSQIGLSGTTLTNGTSAGGSFACNGAVLGDIVDVSLNQPLQGVRLWGWVSSANTVSWRMENYTGGSVTLTTGTLTASCAKTITSPTY